MLAFRWKIAQWFELRWWKHYLQGKDKQTYLAWKRNYWTNIINKITPYIALNSASEIIDLGCGPAGVFIALADNLVTAVDPLIDEYEQQIFFFRKSDYPNTTFIKSTIEDFKPQDANKKFDTVFCMNAINHVNDIEKAFENSRALCHEQGAIIVSIDAHRFSFFKHLFRLIPGDILHPHQYDLAEYQKLLVRNDLKITACKKLKQEFFFSHYLLVALPNTK